MRQTTGTRKSAVEKTVKDMERAPSARQHMQSMCERGAQYSSEEKIRIVLDGLRGEDNETLSAIGPRTMVEC